MTSRRTLVGALALVVTVLLTAAAAQAAVGDPVIGSDRTGDVKGFRHDAGAGGCGTDTEVDARHRTSPDITTLSANHEAGRLVATVSFANLKRSTEQSTVITLRTDRKTFQVDISGRRTPGFPQAFFHEHVKGKPAGRCGLSFVVDSELSCDGLDSTISPELDLVSLTIPTACLENPSWVRVGAAADVLGRTTSYHDTWAPPGTSHDRPVGPFSPPVLVPAT